MHWLSLAFFHLDRLFQVSFFFFFVWRQFCSSPNMTSFTVTEALKTSYAVGRVILILEYFQAVQGVAFISGAVGIKIAIAKILGIADDVSFNTLFVLSLFTWRQIYSCSRHCLHFTKLGYDFAWPGITLYTNWLQIVDELVKINNQWNVGHFACNIGDKSLQKHQNFWVTNEPIHSL